MATTEISWNFFFASLDVYGMGNAEASVISDVPRSSHYSAR